MRLAGRLRRLVRPGDTVSRIGGDEFVVVCGGLAAGVDVDQMQARIEEAVGRPLLLRGGTEMVTASVGMAIAGSADSPEAVISRADEAMYQAKRRRPEVENVGPASGRPLPVLSGEVLGRNLNKLTNLRLR